jgi:Peptidase propeptide and YPEB domain
MRKFLIIPAVALSLAAVSLTAVQPAVALDDLSERRLNVPRDQWLSPTQIGEKLSAKGYKVYEIETDDGAYEVEMTDKNGVRMEAHIHPATGEILVGYDD